MQNCDLIWVIRIGNTVNEFPSYDLIQRVWPGSQKLLVVPCYVNTELWMAAINCCYDKSHTSLSPFPVHTIVRNIRDTSRTSSRLHLLDLELFKDIDETGYYTKSLRQRTENAWYGSSLPLTITLRWRHNGCSSVSNHQAHDCLINRLFRRRSKKTSKLRVTGLCAGIHRGPVNSPHKWQVTRKMFPFDDVIMIPLQ